MNDAHITPGIRDPFSAGTDFRRQNQTSKDGPRAEKIKQLIVGIDQ